MENKKNLILITIGIIILILISFFLYNRFLTEKKIDDYELIIEDEFLSYEDQIKRSLAYEFYMTCESLKADGNRDKCREIYNNPKYLRYTRDMVIENEIIDCVIQSAYRKAIISKDINECEKIRNLKEFEDEDEEKYIQGCKEAIIVTSIESEEDCLRILNEFQQDEFSMEICKEYIKFKKNPSVIHTEEAENLRNADALGTLVLWTAYTTKNIEFCNLADPKSKDWYGYKTCIYEVLDGNIEEDFCLDYPPLDVYLN
jgi:hypothetical protein